MPAIMTTRPSSEMHEQLKKEAGKRGLTMNAMVLQILWEWLERNGMSDHTHDSTRKEVK